MTDNNQDKDQAGSSTSPWVPALIVLLVLVLGLAYLGVKSMGTGGSGPKRQNVKIAVLPDTPPPPPPPPKEERKPEPEKQEDKPMPQEAPKPQDTPPEPAPIKMEGAAGDGESAFQSGGVSSDYKGGDPNGNGGGMPANRMQFGLFANQLKRHIQTALAKDREIKGREYQLKVLVWLDKDGGFQRVELDSSSGDAELDQALTRAFKRLPPISTVPADLPQPALLRLTNRMAG
ncbi:MAG: TonB C-terminal domain-containing protein [Aquabacterium sp.]|uniref:TonB C-terminal domain-containing protein n=1 Tax=Aquabacterium sp. TaxID=1872578 RepID=UPI0025C25E49|nr:TonB C-terminal domain-containing protein [Aquabacterium sp.]MBI5924876.1 TonB C-terminal domain-containing protein [Aquabacterium sp.]